MYMKYTLYYLVLFYMFKKRIKILGVRVLKKYCCPDHTFAKVKFIPNSHGNVWFWPLALYLTCLGFSFSTEMGRDAILAIDNAAEAPPQIALAINSK